MPFQPGQSGNPGGRPKGVKEAQESARALTAEAYDTLAKWMRSADARASVAACSIILDRGWGKAESKINADVTHRYVARMPEKAESPEAWQKQHTPKLTIQ